MGPGANRQVHIRGRNAKLLKKHVRHIRVVVLASMNQSLDDVLARLERVHHRRHFHKIRASPYDVKYVHSFSDQRPPRLNYLQSREREEFGAGGTESAPPPCPWSGPSPTSPAFVGNT